MSSQNRLSRTCRPAGSLNFHRRRLTLSCGGSIRVRSRQPTIGRSSPTSTSRRSKPPAMRSAPSPQWPLAKTGSSQSAATARCNLATSRSAASLAKSMPSRFHRTKKRWLLPAAHRGSTESPRCSKSRPAKNFANSPAIATHFTASPFRRMAINWPQPDTTASSSFGTPHPAKNSVLSRDTTALFTASRSARTGASLAAPAATHPSNFGTPQTANGSTPSGNRPANSSSPPLRPTTATSSPAERTNRFDCGAGLAVTKRGSIRSNGYDSRTRTRLPISRSTQAARAWPRLPLIGRSKFGRSPHSSRYRRSAANRTWSRRWCSARMANRCTSAEWTAQLKKSLSAWPSAQIPWPRRTSRPSRSKQAKPSRLSWLKRNRIISRPRPRRSRCRLF